MSSVHKRTRSSSTQLPPLDEHSVVLSRLPPAAQVQACREATAAAAAKRTDTAESTSPPPPCDLPMPVATLAGSCEAVRTRF